MMTKINALIMAIYLFFAGFIYGDEPIKVDFDCEFSQYEFACPEEFSLRVSVKCKNVGRPFEGKDPFEALVAVYREENGKMIILNTLSIIDMEECRPILVKKGDTFYGDCIYEYHPYFADEYKPGVYSVAVWVYGCKKVYKDIITIGSGEEV